MRGADNPLPLWEVAPLDEAAAREWLDRAYRIAFGVELVAHLEPLLNEEQRCVGFCAGNEPMAEKLADAIRQENIGARVTRAHPGETDQPLACDVVLPCAPWADDEAVEQAVLGAVKASHAVLCVRPEQ